MFGGKKGKDDGADGEEAKDEVEMADQNAAESKEDEAPSVGEMRRGDYMIHVFVEKGKEFAVPESSTIDPLVEVTCLNQKQYSSAKDNIGGLGEVVWSEHLFLEPKNVEKVDAEEGKIVIKLLDKGFLKNSLIGVFDFDLSYIYNMKDHLLLHQWIALSNPNSEDYAKITGYLKISISVACTGDEQV